MLEIEEQTCSTMHVYMYTKKGDSAALEIFNSGNRISNYFTKYLGLYHLKKEFSFSNFLKRFLHSMTFLFDK